MTRTKRRSTRDSVVLIVLWTNYAAFTLPSSTNGTMEEESQDCVRVSDSSAEAMEELSITECRVVDQSLCITDPPMRSLENFEPEIYNHEGKGAYRFQCPSAGLFQCSITGLVFRMEGEGEVLYRTVHWDMRLLSQNGKRPAGPLFNIDCPQKSVCQLHLPHCQIHSDGGCDFLSVAHVTDDNVEFLPPHETTDTHVIINITGSSAYGDVTDDDAPISPIQGLLLLFYQPFLSEERSILNVLLLPRNVVIREVQEERKRRNGDKETFVETNPHCNLTPKKAYILSTDITDGYRISPTTAEFLDFQSYENYFPTFQLFLLTVVKEFDLLLKENGCTENQWERRVWLPAPVQVQPHGPVAPVPAASAEAHGPAVPIQLQAVPTLHQPAPQPAGPAQVQPHGPAAPTAVHPSVRED
ncbi:NACHT, LRR and PYD domains-containing protein 1b allele 3-like [Oncorhynchus mykiss]|uniref:NACHT, LRR and PYD domains-containing protein 1b allele 3-like n=1 Tax=Oncorhynchus mykiss TaxID=8022 RepID=UPI000B4FB665|nr:NACHT, LRR and PYD domains-containing protein 1b allele 3-like [Oncorhynchus mykiss]